MWGKHENEPQTYRNDVTGWVNQVPPHGITFFETMALVYTPVPSTEHSAMGYNGLFLDYWEPEFERGELRSCPSCVD